MTLSKISLAGAAFLITAGAAMAAPLAPTPLVDAGVGIGGSAQVIPVAGGCGFGEHRGPYGGCRINDGPRGAIRAATTGLPRGCPPGMVRGYYGRCHY